MRWRPINEFDPDDYQVGWILFFRIGMGKPVIADCHNRDHIDSVDIYGLFDLFLFIEKPKGEI